MFTRLFINYHYLSYSTTMQQTTIENKMNFTFTLLPQLHIWVP